MKDYDTKVYIVQKADGSVIAAKLIFSAAHAIAKANAPCKMLFSRADKSLDPNVVEYGADQDSVQLIARPGIIAKV